MTVHTPECTHSGLGSFLFARRYSGNRFFFLFLCLLRCFSSAGSPPMTILFTIGYPRSARTGFPIQKSAGHRICAPPRSLSQLITSFVGSQCQGIHLVLFLAWPDLFPRGSRYSISTHIALCAQVLLTFSFTFYFWFSISSRFYLSLLRSR